MYSSSTRKVSLSLFALVGLYYTCQLDKEQLTLEYTQRVELLALFKHVKLGAYSPEKDTNTGIFDIVGADRR